MGVAGPCDRPPLGTFSGRMLAGNQTGESHKRGGAAEPVEITHLDTQDGGRQGGDATQDPQPPNRVTGLRYTSTVVGITR